MTRLPSGTSTENAWHPECIEGKIVWLENSLIRLRKRIVRGSRKDNLLDGYSFLTVTTKEARCSTSYTTKDYKKNIGQNANSKIFLFTFRMGCKAMKRAHHISNSCSLRTDDGRTKQ
ncbi:hypothetical protein KIN20_005132 [Parelaphostrongylus tenuis]|uniref:Uncharacterized protein n=1 Tax=Parelaphostrongylus tenuis TaxID=148309 RepID=A0AAD5QFQ0_PARTN|nr:hypothetical protein KIN20_005132 [Parelaphostrongylus tenuis]